MGVFKELEGEFDYDIVEEFLGHFGFMIDSLEPLIIDLEKSEKFSTNIDNLFRIFHNIKSASGYLKIEPINKLATLAEETLEECRLVDGSGSDELIDWLLAVSDQMANYKQDLDNDRDEFTPTSPKLIRVPTKFVK